MVNSGGWDYIPSPARKLGVAVNREASFESQFMVSLAVCLNSRAEYKQNAVLDRTPIDSAAYSMYQRKRIWGPVDDNEFQVMLDICKRSLKAFDMVFYFPVYWNPAKDGFRDTDAEYQKDVDSYIITLLNEWNVDYLKVPNLKPEERLIWIKKEIENANLHIQV